MPFARRRTRNSTAAWMWLAIAAVAFTAVARAETGGPSPKGYSHPVFEFLARSQAHNSAAHSASLRFSSSGPRRQATSIFRNSNPAPLIAMLPMWFIGMVSPPALSIASNCSLGPAPATPLLSALFQRPPPSRA